MKFHEGWSPVADQYLIRATARVGDQEVWAQVAIDGLTFHKGGSEELLDLHRQEVKRTLQEHIEGMGS